MSFEYIVYFIYFNIILTYPVYIGRLLIENMLFDSSIKLLTLKNCIMGLVLCPALTDSFSRDLFVCLNVSISGFCLSRSLNKQLNKQKW